MQLWLGSLLALLSTALLPLLRVSAVLVTAPILGDFNVPARAKMLLAVTLALLVAPLHAPAPPVLTGAWWTAAFTEIAIGLLIGFTFKFIFEGIQMGAAVAAQASALSFGELASPNEVIPSGAIGSLYAILAILSFLSFNGHLLILKVLVTSFSGIADPLILARSVLDFAAYVLIAGVLLAAPVIAALLGVHLAMGAVSKAAPALNLFAVGFPAALLIGLIAIGWSLNGLPGMVGSFTERAVAAASGAP